MTKHVAFAAVLCAISLTACSGTGVSPGPPSSIPSLGNRSAQTITTHGDFSEYSLPSGINPSDLTRGPYDTVYFTHPSVGGPPTVWEMAATSGNVTSFTAPAPYLSTGFSSIISLNRSVYYVVYVPVNEDEFYFAQVTPEGVYSFTGAPYFEYGILTNFALTPNGTSFTYGYCIDPCQGPNNGVAAGANLTDYFIPTAITGGPGGYIYATAVCGGPCNPALSDSRVYVISTSATIVHTFHLPNGSHPAGIVTGSDHNLWITEPGINKIARMTPTGTVTQFKIPTANSGADRITYGYDTAQYFTETAANKIGRIGVKGHITEYAIPTANSQPTGITPCAPTASQGNCGTYGGVWFTETAANQIGRLDAPI